MVETRHIGHVVKLLGLVLCLHRFWPRGIVYSESEKRRYDRERSGVSRSHARRNRDARSYNGSTYGDRERGRRVERYWEDVKSEGGGRRGRRGEWLDHEQPPMYEAKGSWYYD